MQPQPTTLKRGTHSPPLPSLAAMAWHGSDHFPRRVFLRRPAHLERDLRLRICTYTDTALPKLGGQEVVVDSLARQFMAAGHEVKVLAPRPKGSTAIDRELPYPVVRHPGFVSTRWLVSWYRRYVMKLYRQWPFDVLHCHSVYRTGYVAALCRDKLPVPIVITSHGGDVYAGNCRLRKRGLAERHRLAIEKADALIAISDFTADGFRQIAPDAATPIVPIPNGVDLEPFAKQAPLHLPQGVQPEKYLLFLGRLHERKGVDLLLRAAAKVSDSLGDVSLVIAGDGGERAALEELARQLGLAGRTHFVGRVVGEQKIGLLQHCLAAVMPSRYWEAFGLVALEAYAAGRPVVATRLPGLGDVVRHERTGLLVEPENVEQLATALERIVTDESARRRWSEQALATSRDYSWQRIAASHLELFQQLIDQRAAHGAVRRPTWLGTTSAASSERSHHSAR